MFALLPKISDNVTGELTTWPLKEAQPNLVPCQKLEQ